MMLAQKPQAIIPSLLLALLLLTVLCHCDDATGPAGAPDSSYGTHLDQGPPKDQAVLDLAGNFDAPADTAAPDFWTDFGGYIPGTWQLIPAGTFTMGSPPDEPCRYYKENLHQVTLTRAFEMQTTEVTQAQFAEVLGYTYFYFDDKGVELPAESASWHMAAAYCNALSARKGYTPCYDCSGAGRDVRCQVTAAAAEGNIYACPGYRLPTDAEWEYACRAGTQTATYNGQPDECVDTDPLVDEIAWYYGTDGTEPHPVGQKKENAWHLFDMLGNVSEWCHDWYEIELAAEAVTDPWGPATSQWRVIRGGSWDERFRNLRAAWRYCEKPAMRMYNIGFRCVRSQ